MAQDSLQIQTPLQLPDTLLHQSQILQTLDSIADLTNYVNHFGDSLQANSQWVQDRQRQADSLADLPAFYLDQIDSLIQVKANLLQEQIDQWQSQAADKLTQKVGGLDSIANLETDKLLGEKFSDLNSDQYKEQLGKVNELLKEYTAKITDKEELQWVEHYSGQLNQLEGVVQDYQGKLMEVEQVQLLQSYSDQLKQLAQESQGYFQQAQSMVEGGLTEDSPLMKSLESKIGHYPEFQELQKQTEALQKLKSKPTDYQKEYEQYQDPKYLQQQALEQAKKLGTNRFKQHQDKLQTAQKKLADYKKKYSSIQSTKDMSTAVKRNSLEGKTLSERLVLGGTLQVDKEPTSLDVSPLLGYKLNRKYTVGLGATYRAVLNFNEFNAEEQVYGFRAFFQREAVKGFFVHGEFERMNVAPDSAATNAETTRRWKSGVLAGIGKEYNFIKNVNGQVMVLYNFMHQEGITPYNKRWVFRFGFSLNKLTVNN